MKSLIIPCSGQSSRMSKFFFPKCLLPLHQRPILFQIIECWKPYIDQIIIVHNKKNKNIIQNYMNEFFNNEHIKLSYCLQEKKSGTYFAIKKALRHCDNECMIWNWSDVCLKKNRKEPIFVTDKNTNYILTTDKQLCRWKFIENEFFHDTKMKLTKNGIYGIFIINDNSKIFLENYQIESENEREVLECLNPNSFRQYTWEKFYDIGDEKKYSKKLRCSQKEIRAFGSRNEIIFKNNQVIKYIHDEKLRNCEKNWYKNANFSFIPRVISFEPFKLERLDAIPCCEKFDVETLTVEAEEKLIQKMFFILEEIHTCKKPIPATYRDSYDQYIGKTIRRLKRIDFLFSDIKDKDTGMIKINGKWCKDPVKLLQENENEIQSYFVNEFRFIHGDLQLSNTLMKSDDSLYVIDPRGYFGDSHLFGDPLYDYAKLYYGFCGIYGRFSKGENCFNIDNEGHIILEPLMNEKIISRRRALFKKYLDRVSYLKNINMKHVDVRHAIIWLSVAEYTANDVLSCLYSYLHGTKLINEFFNRKKTEIWRL